MSRHHHKAAETVETIQHDLNDLSKEELEQMYGIALNSDGSVFDSTYKLKFNSISDWMTFEAEQNEMDFSEDYGHGKQTHSDFY